MFFGAIINGLGSTFRTKLICTEGGKLYRSKILSEHLAPSVCWTQAGSLSFEQKGPTGNFSWLWRRPALDLSPCMLGPSWKCPPTWPSPASVFESWTQEVALVPHPVLWFLSTKATLWSDCCDRFLSSLWCYRWILGSCCFIHQMVVWSLGNLPQSFGLSL